MGDGSLLSSLWRTTSSSIWLMVLSCSLLLQLDSVIGQDCTSPEISEEEFRVRYTNPDMISAQHVGTIKEFSMLNTLKIESTLITNMNRKFIDAVYDENTNILRVLTTDDMAFYEEEQYRTEFTLTIELSCASTNTRLLYFRQLIDESNNHAPKFGQSEYRLKVPLPLAKGFTFNFSPEIFARDLDIRNNRVTFSTSANIPLLTIGTSTTIGSDFKTFYPTIITSQQVLRLTESIEFILIATDQGKPEPRSDSATIIIEADEDVEFIAVPQFERPFYRGSLNAELVLNLPQLVIKPETFSSEIAFGFSEGDSSLFTMTNEANVITVRLQRPLTEADIQNRAVFLTTLVANLATDEQGSTVILVDPPPTTTPAPSISPAFEKNVYIGSLDVDRKLTLENIIIKLDSYDASIALTIEGADATLFKHSSSSNIVTVELARELTDSDVSGKTVLTASIQANRPNVGVANAAIVVEIETTTPAPAPIIPIFERSFYEGNISQANQLTYPNINLVTFYDDVVFELQGDNTALFRLTQRLNEISIELIRDLLPSDLTNSYIIVRVLAKRTNGATGTTEFIVSLPSIVSPSFNLGITVGKIDLERKLTIPAIELTPGAYPSNVQFALKEDSGDSSLFRAVVESGVVKIELAQELTEAHVRDRTYFQAELTASNGVNSRGISAIIVDIEQPAPIVLPKFTKPIFRGSLGLNLELDDFEDVTVAEQTYDTSVSFSLQPNNDYELFRIGNTLNSVDVSLSRALTDDDVADRTYLMAVLNANRPQADPVSSVLLVNLPVTTPRPEITPPVFSKPIFYGSIDEDTKLSIENVVLVESTYSSSITFELSGNNNSLFTYTNLRNVLTIQLKEDVIFDQFDNEDFLSFEVVAIHPEANRARTAVLISTPERVCPVSSIPSFENKVYTFSIKNNTVGSIGRVTAVVASNKDATFEYRLDANDLSSRLTIGSSSGELTLNAVLNEGTHILNVNAVDTETRLEGQSEIRIIVESMCSIGDSSVSVENALLVKYLIENQQHSNVMSSVIEDCTFKVIKTIPSGQEFISIDPATKQITTIALDREADIFDGMEVPQIQVTLQLQCESQTTATTTTEEPSSLESDSNDDNRNIYSHSLLLNRSISPQSGDNRFYVLTESIPFLGNTTMLTIIIEDDNDNVPQFVRPLLDNEWLGYPDAQLAETIMPPYLYQVMAIDRDSGINAQIRYSLVDSTDFQINGQTGIITPVRDAMKSDEDIVLTLRATDRNGAADGNSKTKQLHVRRLEQKHISVITIQEETMDEVEYILDNIFKAVSVELKVLHSAIIPMNNETSTARAGTPVNALRMFVYAFDSNTNLMESSMIQEKLKNFDAQIYKLVTETFEYLHIGNIESTDLTGLIVGCCVLFALLLLSILGTFLLWFFKIRPYDYIKMEDTSSVSSQKELAVTATNVVAPPQSSPIMKIDRFEVQKRDSVEIRGMTLDSSDDNKSIHKLAASLNNRLEPVTEVITPSTTSTLESDNTRKPTGVRFNEQVERIDILVDEEAESTGFGESGSHVERF